MEVCYKLIRGDIARELASKIVFTSSLGFGLEIIARISKFRKSNGSCFKFLVLPIWYFPKSIAESKKIKVVRDGPKVVLEVFRFNILS